MLLDGGVDPAGAALVAAELAAVAGRSASPAELLLLVHPLASAAASTSPNRPIMAPA